jgi:hypothetical protein
MRKTTFNGGIRVSPGITPVEAKELLDTCDGLDTQLNRTGDARQLPLLGWVADTTRNYVVWNGGEFYQYRKWMDVVVSFLLSNDPNRNFGGIIVWEGHDLADQGAFYGDGPAVKCVRDLSQVFIVSAPLD